jgi:hypothetical protein
MKERARQVIEDLESLRDALLDLSDDIWLSIDHNDPEALEEGVAFKKAFNEKSATLQNTADELAALIEEHTGVSLDTHESTGEAGTTADRNERIIRELDRREEHALDEDFTYKRPFGFVLEGTAHTGVRTRTDLYVAFCRQLAEAYPEAVRRFPETEAFLTSRGNRTFTRDPSPLRSPKRIADDVYAETHYSANGIRDQMRAVLDVLDVDESAMTVYLREDRDAE